MTRAERKAIQARVAVRVLAQLAAKNAVKHQIRAQGLRLHDFAAKDIRGEPRFGSRLIRVD
jgi:hypothetical protein